MAVMTGLLSDIRIIFVESNQNEYRSNSEFIEDIYALYDCVGIEYKPIDEKQWIEISGGDVNFAHIDLVNRIALIPITSDWFEYFA